MEHAVSMLPPPPDENPHATDGRLPAPAFREHGGAGRGDPVFRHADTRRARRHWRGPVIVRPSRGARCLDPARICAPGKITRFRSGTFFRTNPRGGTTRRRTRFPFGRGTGPFGQAVRTNALPAGREPRDNRIIFVAANLSSGITGTVSGNSRFVQRVVRHRQWRLQRTRSRHDGGIFRSVPSLFRCRQLFRFQGKRDGTLPRFSPGVSSVEPAVGDPLSVSHASSPRLHHRESEPFHPPKTKPAHRTYSVGRASLCQNPLPAIRHCPGSFNSPGAAVDRSRADELLFLTGLLLLFYGRTRLANCFFSGT